MADIKGCDIGQTVKPSSIQRELNKLRDTISMLEENSKAITKRFSSVLRCELTCENGQPDKETLVPLADEIRSIRERAMGINDTLQTLLGLCEL